MRSLRYALFSCVLHTPEQIVLNINYKVKDLYVSNCPEYTNFKIRNGIEYCIFAYTIYSFIMFSAVKILFVVPIAFYIMHRLGTNLICISNVHILIE